MYVCIYVCMYYYVLCMCVQYVCVCECMYVLVTTVSQLKMCDLCMYVCVICVCMYLRQQCHNSKCVIFQERLLKVLKCFNFLWVQQRHNCSPAARFANCIMTLYLLKVRLQTFISIPITQKCQILSCDTLVANEQCVCVCVCVCVCKAVCPKMWILCSTKLVLYGHLNFKTFSCDFHWSTLTHYSPWVKQYSHIAAT